MPQGTVKWFNGEKGYGFITPNDGSEGLFVHPTGIAGSGFKSLEEGTSVSYKVARGRKGMQAVNVSSVGSTDGPDSGQDGGPLRVPLEMEGAARSRSEHFEPEGLYWAMAETVRRKRCWRHDAVKGLGDGVAGKSSRTQGSRLASR